MQNVMEKLESLERRLAELEQFRLIAGNRIRIAKTDTNTWLVEAEEQDVLTDELRAWIMDTDQKLNAAEQEYSTYPPAQTESAGGTGTDYSTPYRIRDYPFRVRLDGPARRKGESTAVILCGDGNGGPGLVYAGQGNTLEIAEQHFSVSSDCKICLTLRPAYLENEDESAALCAAVEITGDYPVPDSSLYVVPIAEIEYRSTGKAVIHQHQFGHIFVAGRIV